VFNKNRKSDPGPGGSPPRYPGTFLQAFREAAGSLGWKVRRSLGDAVECVDDQGEERTVGLENLYRRVRRHGRETWPELIADFLRKVFAGTDKDSDDLNAVADRILVRLARPFTGLPKDAQVWSHPLGDTGLIACLVVDHAETMRYVTEDMVTESGKPGEEWLERGLANLRERTPEGCLEQIDEDSGLLVCCTGDAYDAARALLLDDLLPETRELGCFVGAPSRDQLLVVPVTGKGFVQVHLLHHLIEKAYKTAPYTISDKLFWVHEGTWREFRIEFKDKTLSVWPPEEFIPVLERLKGMAQEEPGEPPG